MPVAELAQGGQEIIRRDDVASLAEDRLHEHGRDAVDPGVRVVHEVL